MNNAKADKAPAVASKSFMTVGPTLHYSHQNVWWCWLAAMGVFTLCCFFWSKILTGSFLSFDPAAFTDPQQWRLDRAVTAGVSIFEYPWQILVLGLLMGVIAVVPVLVSQLLSFAYSVPLILAVLFAANLPAFAGCLLLSCFAVATRPLRFRSRFIAVALCMAPQLIFWGRLGSARGTEPLKWGLCFAPWVCAWIIALGIAAIVLGIGHYTRYKPGLVWLTTTVFLVLATVTFETRIGFDELDYQLYVANNNPEQVSQFRDHSISEALDRTIQNPQVRKLLAGFFYPTDPIQLRAELKKEIQAKLELGRWPYWFRLPAELKFEQTKQSLLSDYDTFISRRPKSRRMPIALYYKALLTEMAPDLNLIVQQELLHFYSDYPHPQARDIWWTLYSDFGDSPESAEARWRIAYTWAGQQQFEQADRLAQQAQEMVTNILEQLTQEHQPDQSFFGLFRRPADSVMTRLKLEDLQRRLNYLRNLIGRENRTDNPATRQRLALFISLNPHSADYDLKLDELLDQTDPNDPLRDNLLLAQAMRIPDSVRQAQRLAELHTQFKNSDGGIQALYELARLRIKFYQNEQDPERKQQYLLQARASLTNFLKIYPDSFCAAQVRNLLNELPRPK